MTEPNEEYYYLKARLDKWGVWLILVYPLLSGIILVFGGIWLGHKFLPGATEILGFFGGGFLWQASCFYLWKRKFGFIMFSEEKCQNCNMSMARYSGAWLALDYMCRECGNNNSIELSSLKPENTM